jgi:hypothetical protein
MPIRGCNLQNLLCAGRADLLIGDGVGQAWSTPATERSSNGAMIPELLGGSTSSRRR